jgi:hypothetical protein
MSVDVWLGDWMAQGYVMCNDDLIGFDTNIVPQCMQQVQSWRSCLFYISRIHASRIERSERGAAAI